MTNSRIFIFCTKVDGTDLPIPTLPEVSILSLSVLAVLKD